MAVLLLTLFIFAANATDSVEISYAERTYKAYCVGCHGLDGKGNGSAANFVDDKTRLAKSDEELVDSILNGKGGMPAYGWMISNEQALELVMYIRTKYGDSQDK